MWNEGKGRIKGLLGACSNITDSEKTYCLVTKQDTSPNSGLIEYDDFCRYLTRRELERCQTLPDGYTDILESIRQCEAVIGNGWTVDVIVHIFKITV